MNERITKYENAEKILSEQISVSLTIKKSIIKGLQISYAEIGNGPPLVFVHGVNMGWGQWYPNLAYFATNFKVYAIDLPGAGGSDPIDSSLFDPNKHLVEILEEFIKQKKINKLDIIAHSLGAWVALKMGLRNPDLIKKMVVVSPLGFTKHTPIKHMLIGFRSFAKLLANTVMKPSADNLKKYMRGVMNDSAVIKPEFVDYYTAVVQKSKHNHPFLFINQIAGPISVRKEFVFTESQIKQMNWPMLVISGGLDPIVKLGAQELSKFEMLPKARIEIFTDSGHVPSMEENNRFNLLAEEFLSGK
jgi:pimeloyl-ACP methyl ester carboxylesterase